MKRFVWLALGLLLVVSAADLAAGRAVAQVVATSEKRASDGAGVEGRSPASDYFSDLLKDLKINWPKNRRISFVFHGHSVPAGYFQTPVIQTFDAYPMLFHQQMCKQFPTAKIDVSVTAIGGEKSDQGAKRFERDVLSLSPDVVFIDYSLNDRRIGLEEAETSWRSMIERCQAAGVKVVLLTPTADTREDIVDPKGKLSTHAAQVRRLAREYKIPLVDSYTKFGEIVKRGDDLKGYMSSVNHPNRAGHELVADLLAKLFVE